MRSWVLLATLPIAILSSAVFAQDQGSVTACETLIATRRIDAATGAARATPEPGCRQVPRSEIGPVEQRALIGGAPYECMTITGAGRCLWVVP